MKLIHFSSPSLTGCQLTCDLGHVLHDCWNSGSSGELWNDSPQKSLPVVGFDGFMFQCLKCISASQKYTWTCKNGSVMLFILFHQTCFACIILMQRTYQHFFSTMTMANAPNSPPCTCFTVDSVLDT